MQNNAQHRLAMVVNALGDNAEDVANLLRYGGWRGQPHDANTCPVALYLRTVVTDVTDAAVNSEQATVHTADGEDIEVELTPAVAGFVLAFDVGAYPELVVTATDAKGDVIDDPDL
ncbi:hypothetical protein [Jidongwangia harbinensis]|uniref:hypothetical protein n=1 Tax=Jidongwangia harbinensis TaxID=2878561 RepID=UPI001CD98FAB|nr:hypothetical protein [Jidongwangia harbinensis]MCA2215815.1 hypothetical protein [Jidongwangia harbinensis]